jgi:hypothetical protein
LKVSNKTFKQLDDTGLTLYNHINPIIITLPVAEIKDFERLKVTGTRHIGTGRQGG